MRISWAKGRKLKRHVLRCIALWGVRALRDKGPRARLGPWALGRAAFRIA